MIFRDYLFNFISWVLLHFLSFTALLVRYSLGVRNFTVTK